MKRKIIKQGHNVLTITLPSKWTKQFNLKAGDEIDLNESGNSLRLSTERKDEKLRTEFDISGLDITGIWKYFMSVYREGYDEVKVNFNPNDIYENPYKFYTRYAIDMRYDKEKLSASEMVQSLTNRFIGFEVVEHHENYCIIKDVAEISSREFDASLRRVFLLIQQMGEELVEAIEKGNTKILLHTHDIDINVDKFHDYCIRVLNKTAFKDMKRTSLIFSVLYLLELVGDEFKHIAHHIVSDMKGKELKDIQELSKHTVEQFNSFYNLFYNYDKNKLIELTKSDMGIHSYLPKLYKKKPRKQSELTDDELEIFHHLRVISKYINALVELRVEMEY